MTNKQEQGVGTPKFEHNISKKGDKEGKFVSLLELVATAKSLILRRTWVIFGNLPIQQ